jgi:hypothetical protein
MNKVSEDPLDRALAQLPREVPLKRDLWSSIQAEIAAQPEQLEPERIAPGSSRSGFTPRWYQMAAAVLLVVASSVTTYIATRESPSPSAPLIADHEPPQPQVIAMPASFAGHNLGDDYLRARASLDAEFERRLASLPAGAREKVERNLADIRVAAQEISKTLAQHPSDPLLQELLLSTYQNELRLLADVTQMSPASPTRVEL